MNGSTVIYFIHLEILSLEITLMLASGAKITIIFMLKNRKKNYEKRIKFILKLDS